MREDRCRKNQNQKGKPRDEKRETKSCNPWGCTHTHTHTHTGSLRGYLVWNKIVGEIIKTHVLYDVFCVWQNACVRFCMCLFDVQIFVYVVTF